MEKAKKSIKNKDIPSLAVGAMELNVAMERKLGTMGQSMKENGRMIHNKAKDNSLALINEFIQVAGKIINYMDMENSLGLTVKNSQEIMNMI